METPKKLIITSKLNLQNKYGANFTEVNKLLNDIVEVDKSRQIDTIIVFIDDNASATSAGINPVNSITRRSVKQAVDQLYLQHTPAYITIFGAADIIPFQELVNPIPHGPNDEDSDAVVPSDLPYACNAPYSTKIDPFTGPTRVVGRIPDITGLADVNYLKSVVQSIIDYKPKDENDFLDYFAITAQVWEQSTRQSMINIFGNATKLLNSPPAAVSHSSQTLKPLTHFYNCHGAPNDSKFYGQQGQANYPTAMESADLVKKISFGTIVAAECCYGAELYNPADEDGNKIGIANEYLKNGAIAFVGSSTIAYGPASGQGLADLITQYFIKNVLAGASTGRAFLEAQQRFLMNNPQIDPYELKTLGQFYLLGDPSLQVVKKIDIHSIDESVVNRRLNLNKKGTTLKQSIEVSKRVKDYKKTDTAYVDLKGIFEETGFTGEKQEFLFEVPNKTKNVNKFTKALHSDKKISFRVFVKNSKLIKKNLNDFSVLVVKESGNTILGWKVYHRK